MAFANLLIASGGSFFASSRPALPFTSTLLFRMRCNRVRRFLSEYPAFDFQLSTFNLPPGAFLVPIPARNPFKHLHLQLFLDKDRNHVVICYLILRHHLRRPSPQHASLRDLCTRRLRRPGRGGSALDSSSLGLTLNLQSEVRRLSRPEIPTPSGLSTFNRVSFLSPSSPHLCLLCGENSPSFRSSLIPRHSPLTTKSFTIRTSETPLPQLLYNPHLRAPLGSAGNKGLITPLESALTKNSPVSRLESALAERWGWGYGASRSASWTPVKSHGLPPPEMQLCCL